MYIVRVPRPLPRDALDSPCFSSHVSAALSPRDHPLRPILESDESECQEGQDGASASPKRA